MTASFLRFSHSLVAAGCLLLPGFLAAQSSAPSYTFSTMAGVREGAGSADGPALSARFGSPHGIALDAAGNFYFSDNQNHGVRKMTPEGIVSTLAGVANSPGAVDGVGTAARFNRPVGLAVDRANNVYVADFENHAIRKITPQGVVSTLAGSLGRAGNADGTGASAQFNTPSGLAMDADDNLYVADRGNHTIRKVTPAGVVTTVAGRAGSAGNTDAAIGAGALFDTPEGVAVDLAGNVFVAARGSSTIRKITPAGVVTTLAGQAYQSDWADGIGSAARFDAPLGVAVDEAGEIVVVDSGNHVIRRVSTSGAVTTLAGLPKTRGNADGTGSAARFDAPRRAVVDAKGNLYVADLGNQTIRKGVRNILPPTAVVGWGQNDSRQNNAPAGLTNAIAIAAGGAHSLALRPDGTVAAWGNNFYGQANVPAGLVGVVAIAAGGHLSLALRSDGVVVAWGYNEHQQTVVPAAASGVVAIATGGPHALALRRDGSVIAWGSNTDGQCTVPPGLSNVISVQAGNAHSLALKADGTVVAWGRNSAGQGLVPAGLSDVVAIAALWEHNLALKRDGTVVAWGSNDANQSTVPAGLSGVVAVAAGAHHSIALRNDGTVIAWVSNDDGERTVPTGLRAVAIAAAGAHSLALTTSGSPAIAVSSPVSVNAGDAPTLTVSAAFGLAYQWYQGASGDTTRPVAGATRASFTTPPLTQTTSYWVRVTNAAGFSNSTTFTIPVTPSRLLNLSVLTAISTPGDSFTLGYVVGGADTSGAKPLVIRAGGPSLGALGVTGTLDDPRLELFAGATKTSENDNWGGTAALGTAMAGVGAFPFSSPASRDAAALASITTRDNSVRVSAVGNGTGAVIAEIYDATPAASFAPTTPRLVNVSVLKHLGTGLTAGFVIGGTGAKTVLIRAIGPTLGAAPFSVPGVVADPRLTLFGAGGTVLGENDNWSGEALQAAFDGVGAFRLPAGSRDAALLVALPAGNYTVQVNGVAGATGVALIEIYEVL